MRLPFSRKKEQGVPSFGQNLAFASESRPTTGQPVDYEASSNPQHLFTLDELVLKRLEGDPVLCDAIAMFGSTCDTNIMDRKSVEVLQVKTRKAFKYMQLRMTREERRRTLPLIKFLEANIFGRLWNNNQGNKIKILQTERKTIVTGEAKKAEEL